MSLPKVIYVMGPPGAGKGTQSELLSQELGYHRFSTGDAFRQMARQDTPLGRRVDEIIHGQGKLMPPKEAAEIVIAAVKEYTAEGKGIIFDGTPRTIEESEAVDEFFLKEGYGRPLAIRLVVDQDEMVARNSKRRFCMDIKNDFPVVTDEDVKKCEELGGRIGRREDDSPEIFAMRWSEFMDKTWPVIKKYKQEGILQEIDGHHSIEEVHGAVMQLISRLRG
ncbi:MAG: nucleoside monophosphate kinase [Candidatus Andersenbacteria bacterium]|nr:nucleoside monophosphate kinase [Candidatus Andersenbacteria bacterium]MBI3251060.1 nucleoside monophosphate kinase [Candidatus Andersenbacteria bacterium]